jgi:hypothetical protein
MYRSKPYQFSQFEEEMRRTYFREYHGLRFDRRYLWSNVDESGGELLYCSEFVAKILNRFIEDDIVPYSMDFSRNWTYWKKYFKGHIPQGAPGISPAQFARDYRFFFVTTFRK